MKKEIKIDGMSCKHCVMHVNNALVELDGVTEVKVSLLDSLAIVETTKDITDQVFKAVINEAGYEVVSIREVL